MKIFQEKLEEFNCSDRPLKVDEYVKQNSVIQLEAVGNVTEELVKFFDLRQYAKIDLSPLYALKEKGFLFRLALMTPSIRCMLQ